MSNLTSSPTKIGGVVKEFLWNWEKQQIRVVYESLGEGSPVLLLPAFSTVSMRSEMADIAKLLSPHFQTVAVDFPGFGDSERPSVDYKPALYKQFLQDFVTSVFDTPVAVIAAGHSAAYVLQLQQQRSNAFSQIVLVAPTWRGPLPTMGAGESVADTIKNLVRSPILGQALYKLNTAPGFLSFMYRRHVYTDTTKLTSDFIEYKWRNTQQPGGRFAPAAFVTGNLDAVNNRDDFLNLAKNLSIPLMVIIGESSPPSSRAEMDALAALSGVESIELAGSLGMHEEYSTEIVNAISAFLKALL